MDKKEEYHKAKVREIERRLRAYCHVEGCLEVYDCPEYHEKCKEKLDLDTSLAWQMAECLKMGNDSECYFLFCTITPHRDKYPDLFHLMDEAYEMTFCPYPKRKDEEDEI